jgi:ribose transport system substrate-binding protein
MKQTSRANRNPATSPRECSLSERLSGSRESLPRALTPVLHTKTDRYQLATVARACEVLRACSEPRRIVDIATQTGLNRTVVFRIVHTLEGCGFLRKAGKGEYQSNGLPVEKRGFRIGYASQAENSPFSTAVTDGLRAAATRERIDLLVLNNCYSAKTALQNARLLVAERVDLAIEFQTLERVAPAISALFYEAGIPLIAVEIPHAGATFYGADNYRVGLSAGRTLGRWARQHWEGRVEEVLLMELGVAGSLPHLRLTGAVAGIQEVLPELPSQAFQCIECGGTFGRAFEMARKKLRHTPERRTLIAGVNDPSVLGAIRAFEEVGRAASCAGFGLGAIPEARAELRAFRSRLIGTIAFFPEQYGTDLIRLALDILHLKAAPPAVYARHHLITRENVNQLYPNDLPDEELRLDVAVTDERLC